MCIKIGTSSSGLTLGTTTAIPGLADASSDAASNPHCLVLLWIVMGENVSTNNRILCTSSIGEEWCIDIRPATPDVRIRLTDDAGNVHTARCALSATPQDGDTLLIGAMMENRGIGTVARGHILCSWSRGGTVYHEPNTAKASVTSGELRGSNPAVVFGGNGADTAAQVSIIGCAVWEIPNTVAVIDTDDMQAIFEDAHPASTWRPPASLTGSGALMENATSTMRAMHGSLSTNRISVGDAMSTGNLVPIFLEGGNMDDTQSVTIAGTVTKISAFEESDHFVRTYPTLDDGESVAGSAPVSSQIVNGTYGTSKRLAIAGNSLAVYYQSQTDDGFPHNVSAGVMNYREEEIAGALFQRPTLGSGENYRRPFYNSAGAAIYTSGTVVDSDTDVSNYGRIGSTSDVGSRGGPGCGIEIAPGGTATIRAFEYGLATDERSLSHEIYLLKGVPGPAAYGVEIQGNVHTAQGSAGTAEGDAVEVTLSPDTSTAFDLSAGGVFASASGSGLALNGDYSGTFPVGTVLGWDNGTRWDFNVVSAVAYNEGLDVTSITFEHAWGSSAALADTDTFYYSADPLEIVSVTVTNDPVSSSNVARGFSMTHTEASGAPPVYFMGATVYTPDAVGIIPGPIGWGGNNYESQLEETFSGMHAALLEAIAPDAMWVMMANNREGGGSAPDPDPMLTDFIAASRANLPNLEVCCLANPIQMTDATGEDWADAEPWGQFMQELAEAGTVNAYLNPTRHEGLGDAATLYADGQCQDSGHQSTRGTLAFATAIWATAGEVFLGITSTTNRSAIRFRAAINRNFAAMRGRALS